MSETNRYHIYYPDTDQAGYQQMADVPENDRLQAESIDAALALIDLREAVGDISELETAITSSIVAAINGLNSNIGDLNNLETTVKTSVINAINEVKNETGNIGDLDNLETIVKTTVVAAINELKSNINDLQHDEEEIKEIDKILFGTEELDSTENKIEITGNENLELSIIEINGKTEQESTNGYQLFKPSTYENLPFNSNLSSVNISYSTDSVIITTTVSSLSGGYARFYNENYISNYDSSNTYYMAYDITSSNACDIYTGYENIGTRSTFTAGQTKRITTTITGNAAIVFYAYAPTVMTIKNIVISTSSSNTNYEPYTNGPSPNPDYPQEVQVITGEQEVIVRGSQLFQTPNTQTLTDVTLTKNNDGSLDIVGTAGANRDFATDFISLADTHLKLGGSYYLSIGQTFTGVSIQIVGYNSNNGWVATTSMQSTTQGQAITLFSDSTITKIKFILRVYSGTTINQQNIKIMLNEGSTALPFEPYITPINKQLSLGNIELAEIGTHRDYIWTNGETKKWYVHKENHKYIFDGTENFGMAGPLGGGYSFYRDWSNFNVPGINAEPFLCNMAIVLTDVTDYGVGKIYSATGIAMNLYPEEEISSVAGFQAKLKDLYDNGTPCYFVYPRATATDTEITDQTLISQLNAIQKLQQLTGTTIVEIVGDNGLNPTFKIVYETDSISYLKDNYVKNTDYATSSKGGVIKGNVNGFEVIPSNGNPSVSVRNYTAYQSLPDTYFIGKGTLENVLNARIGDINTLLDEINGEVI